MTIRSSTCISDVQPIRWLGWLVTHKYLSSCFAGISCFEEKTQFRRTPLTFSDNTHFQSASLNQIEVSPTGSLAYLSAVCLSVGVYEYVWNHGYAYGTYNPWWKVERVCIQY